MRCRDGFCLQPGKKIKSVGRFSRRKLVNFNREFLIEQFVIVGVVDRLQEFLDALAAENPQWLLALINSGSPFNSKQKRRQSGTVIQMQMTNPNRIQVGPIEIS